MAEQEKQPFELAALDPNESHFEISAAGEAVAGARPVEKWEGYSLEILSLWFDP